MAESAASWCGLDDPDDDQWPCADCGREFDMDSLVHLDYPDDGVFLCPLCWRKEREAHPERYDDGEGD